MKVGARFLPHSVYFLPHSAGLLHTKAAQCIIERNNKEGGRMKYTLHITDAHEEEIWVDSHDEGIEFAFTLKEGAAPQRRKGNA